MAKDVPVEWEWAVEGRESAWADVMKRFVPMALMRPHKHADVFEIMNVDAETFRESLHECKGEGEEYLVDDADVKFITALAQAAFIEAGYRMYQELLRLPPGDS